MAKAAKKKAPRTTVRGRAGRPKKEIVLTPEQIVTDMAAVFCSAEEIASVLGISRSTLYERFPDALEKGRHAGKESLRRAQFKAAQKGNPAVLIWLGKQYLGQTDKLPDFGKLTDEELLATAARLFGGDREAGTGETEGSGEGPAN